ncbi:MULTISPECIES: response regulator transcription factor [unclassified Bradyrhizobium]|uniref:response regulator transcription factor n=1 Tax=unclassified Bradyrhizobium TaxID=2631580 RepID=UPI00140DC4AE|nr:response regulator transcription factor [Bradyrhizobium sp. 2S1]MCK7667775.1 response regulator transcription factor [Bradyrhizobium sp. 2S1]
MTRLIITDDHTIFREGLKQILADQADIDIVGEARSGEELLGLLETTPCEIVLLDLSMPGISGIPLLQLLKAKHPGIRIVVLSMHEEHQYVIESLKAGAAGYVTKNSASHQLIQAIRTAARDEMFVSAATREAARRPPVTEFPHIRLTKREREVFDMLVLGRKITDIARRLNLSIKTVSTHKANLMEKMGAATVVDLVHYALRNQLVE